MVLKLFLIINRVLKLIQNFPEVDIQNFIDKYGSLLPNDGAGLIEAQQQLATVILMEDWTPYADCTETKFH